MGTWPWLVMDRTTVTIPSPTDELDVGFWVAIAKSVQSPRDLFLWRDSNDKPSALAVSVVCPPGAVNQQFYV